MIKYIALLLTLTSCSLNSPQPTPFEILGDLYKKGSAPDFQKISGIAWAGRCFTDEEPSKPVNGGYILRVAKNGTGNHILYEATSYWRPGFTTDFYDRLSLADIYKIRDNKFLPAELRNNSIEITEATNVHTLRISNQYLVEEISAPEGFSERNSDIGPISGGMKKIVRTRCYYFIPEIAIR